MGKARKLTLFWSDANDCWVAFKSYWKAIPSEQSASVVDEAAYQKAVEALKSISKGDSCNNCEECAACGCGVHYVKQEALDALKELGEEL